MCYQKPGPRCTAYAMLNLAKAIERKEEMSSSRTASIEDSLQSYRDVEDAQSIFDATPAGLRILNDETAVETSNLQLKARYDLAKATRTSQMEALKSMKLKTEGHDFNRNAYDSSIFQHEFLADDVIRTDGDLNSSRRAINAMSASWLNKLNDEEISQLRWMTDRGAMHVNKYIGEDKTGSKRHSPEQLEERMKLVDSALAKYESDEATIVYRGVREGLLPPELRENYRVATEDKQSEYLKAFKVGSTFKSPYYMPTSFRPDIAKKFSDFSVIMEIKTRKAAPVSPLSASLTEQEGLLPRNSTYMVTGIKEDVLYKRGGVEPSKVTVIQLEAIS